MRGAKKDLPLTKMLQANGFLIDRRSFVGYQADMTPHLYLKGGDVIVQRHRVWNLSRMRCKTCGTPLTTDDWEMHHKQAGLVGRCDCLDNLEAICAICHRGKHVSVKFGGSNGHAGNQ
jgi:hypothetical protein